MTRTMNLFAAMALAACTLLVPDASQARNRDYDRCGNCGTVRSVERYTTRDRHLGGGTVLGAIVGGALGNQVGKGDGRKAATIAGAVAGGAIGHKVEKRRRDRRVVFNIDVRMDNGRIYSFRQQDGYGLRPGDRVVVDDGYVIPRRR